MWAYILHRSLLTMVGVKVKKKDIEKYEKVEAFINDVLQDDVEYRQLLAEKERELAMNGFIEDDNYYLEWLQNILTRLGVGNE